MKGIKKGLKVSIVVDYRDFDKKQKLHIRDDLLHRRDDLLHHRDDLLEREKCSKLLYIIILSRKLLILNKVTLKNKKERRYLTLEE
ncbi:hypothetical protein ES695_10625 [Candidatus Atribacteria bacterium 1244-E10-H5-B2]|nr:MAG: hypothetical protein ES695_10625 [Candidatus Atribacteria bacterium 1244-E10-H5-B2]